MNDNLSNLLETAESYRIEANQNLDQKTQLGLGQFMTPIPVANFMSSLFCKTVKNPALLDPGAGVGSLTSALIHQLLNSELLPKQISIDIYEIDSFLSTYLKQTLEHCKRACTQYGVKFTSQIIEQDYIDSGVGLIKNAEGLFGQPMHQYTHCIMNPPYKKIQSCSKHRQQLRQIDIETSNLYSAFVAIAIKMLAPNGQLVAIIPRSFCNGVYFKPFRQLLLSEMAIKHLHIFESRKQVFKGNRILQENIILHAVKHGQQDRISVTSSTDSTFSDMTCREVSLHNVVIPDDPDQFIHVATNEFDQMVVNRINLFTHSIKDIGLDICTGPVVDFRLKVDIRQQPEEDTFPLIYPNHFKKNMIQFLS